MRLAVRLLSIVLVAGCGDDPVEPVIEPPEVVLTKFASVSAGSEHSCAARIDGVLFCWGSTRGGRLGDGRDAPGAALTPTPVQVEARFVQVDAGYTHTCGVAAGGTAYCWGIGEFGQLGSRTGFTQTKPFFIDEHPKSFLQLVAGERHSCAVGRDYDAYCWGWNFYGQVGNTSTVDQAVPVLVHAPDRIYTLAAGRYHTCGLTGGGRLFCWGRGHLGQLGNAATAERQITPVPVAGNLTFGVMTAGAEHTCALTLDGTAYCWGAGTAGQLGTGTAQSSSVPVRVAGDVRFTAISAGEEHTCAVATTGQVYCWGHNNYGRVGVESLPTVIASPTLIASDVLFSSVSAGRLHSCALARDGAVHCWGNGAFGQLGTATLLAQSPPTRVAEPAATASGSGSPTQ